MLTKIKKYTKIFITNMSDIRFIGQIVLAIIILLASWSTVVAIQTNYELQQQISQLEQEVEINRLETQNLRLENQYLETDTFLELAARRQFGKAAPGEELLLVSKQVAKSYIVQTDTFDEGESIDEQKPDYQQNLEDWKNFFFRGSDQSILEN